MSVAPIAVIWSWRSWTAAPSTLWWGAWTVSCGVLSVRFVAAGYPGNGMVGGPLGLREVRGRRGVGDFEDGDVDPVDVRRDVGPAGRDCDPGEPAVALLVADAHVGQR